MPRKINSRKANLHIHFASRFSWLRSCVELWAWMYRLFLKNVLNMDSKPVTFAETSWMNTDMCKPDSSQEVESGAQSVDSSNVCSKLRVFNFCSNETLMRICYVCRCCVCCARKESWTCPTLKIGENKQILRLVCFDQSRKISEATGKALCEWRLALYWHSLVNKMSVEQACTTYGPRATCGPRDLFLRPARTQLQKMLQKPDFG